MDRYGTEPEKRFVQSAEQHFNQEGRLTDHQKLVLVSLLKEKRRRMKTAMLLIKAYQNSMKQF